MFKQTALGDGRCCWRLSARAGSAVLLPSGAGMLCSRGVSHSQSRELPQPSRGLPRAGRRLRPLPLLSHRKIAFAVFLGLNSGTARMCLGLFYNELINSQITLGELAKLIFPPHSLLYCTVFNLPSLVSVLAVETIPCFPVSSSVFLKVVLS